MISRIRAAWLAFWCRPALVFSPPDGARIISIVPWRDVILIATERGAYMMAHGGASTYAMDPNISFQKLHP